MYYVYKILCVKNNKIYIGQTKNYKRRIIEHKSWLNNNGNKNKELQQDFNTYGISNFKFSVIEKCKTRQESIDRETYWINYYGGIKSNNIYNLEDKYNNVGSGFSGKKHTHNSKCKTSNSLKSCYKSGKHVLSGAVAGDCSGKNNAFYGKHHTDSTKQHLSSVRKGRRKYSSELIEELKIQFQEGETCKELSDIHDISIYSVRKLIYHSDDYLKNGLNRK